MDIAIIGAGIGGLASAIFLARQGHRLTVYEQAEHPRPVGAGFLLQPPGQLVLNQLGVYSDVLTEAIPIHGLHSQTTKGNTLLDLHYTDLADGTLHGLGIQRNNIFNALYLAASKIEGISFKWDTCVEACENEPDSVIVKANNICNKHQLCILSSGTHSKLPQQLFKKRRKATYPWGCLWTTIKLPIGFTSNLLQQRCKGTSKMMGVLPVRRTSDGIEAALYWSMPCSELDSFGANEEKAVRKEIINFWPELKDSIKALNDRAFTCASYNDIWTPKPVKGRIVAVGDACHGTSPQLGQGCTMALLDAISLSKHLAEYEGALDQALATWWHARKTQLAYVRCMSKWLTPLYQSNSAALGFFRDYIMAPAGRLPGLYQLQLKTLASIAFVDSRYLSETTGGSSAKLF